MKENRLEECVEYAIADFRTSLNMYENLSEDVVQVIAKEIADSHVPIHTDTFFEWLSAGYKGKANYLMNYGIESDLFVGKPYVSFVDFMSLVFYDFLLEEILESVEERMEIDLAKEEEDE